MPTLLKVDWDGPRVPADVGALLRAVVVERHRARVRWYALNRSSSGRGWHLRVSVTGKWSGLRVVDAQRELGSDPRREDFNEQRVRGIARAPVHERPALRASWNVLYARKITARVARVGGALTLHE